MDATHGTIAEYISNNKYLLLNQKVILIENVIGYTKHIEQKSRNAIYAEFFSENEIEEIVCGIRHNNIYVEVYFDEHIFINDVINSKIQDLSKIIVFNLTRNGFGVSKKALIPSFCDLMNIRYTGSNAYATTFTRHKFHYSKLLSSFRLCGIDSWLYDEHDWLGGVPTINLDVILKPFCEAASKGVSYDNIINTSSSRFLQKVRDLYEKCNQPIICQEFISGYEVEVPILSLSNITVLPPVGIKIQGCEYLENRIIDENCSLDYTYSFYNAKDILDENIISKIKNTALNIFNTIGMENYGRIDFRIDNNGGLYVIDISSTPYLISHSSFDFIFKSMNLERKDIFLLILLSAMQKQ